MKNQANIAAAHSTPTTLAVATLRSRKSPSGTSGDATRVSSTTNAPSRIAETPSRPSVRAEAQPASFPFTIAYTASISAVVTTTAPATSSRPPAAERGESGTSLSDSASTTAPIGTLTRKIQCQSSVSVRTPPSSTPRLPPPAITNPNTPIAFARSAASVKRLMISDSATAETTAPPRPCTARAATSMPWLVARPHETDASVKSATPPRNIRRCPNRSPSRPPSRRNPPNVSR